MVRVQQKSTRQNHRFSRNIRHSLRNGFNGFLRALPGETGLCCHRRRRDAKHHRQLSTCIGAPGPHDFAVRCIASRLAQKRLTLQRPSHPAPNVRDDREAPLLWARDARMIVLICPTRQYPSACGRLARQAVCARCACASIVPDLRRDEQHKRRADAHVQSTCRSSRRRRHGHSSEHS